MKTAVVGDVHGCYDMFKQIMDKILELDDISTIVMIGDYFDRGKRVKDVLDYLMNFDVPGKKLICLKGNHEDMFLESFERAEYWNIDPATFDSFGIYYGDMTGGYWKTKIDQKYINWLKALQITYEDEDCFYCHAGINPAFDLKNQRESDLLWIRESFLKCKFEHPKYIVHGHTPVKNGPEILHNRLNVDCGAVFYGKMVCCVLEGRNVVAQIVARSYEDSARYIDEWMW